MAVRFDGYLPKHSVHLKETQRRSNRTMKEVYQTLIIGTGLSESILSSLLDSKSILQIDPNPLYGSIKWSTLSLPELIKWSTNQPTGQHFTNISSQIHSSLNTIKSNPYHLNLIPTLLFTKSNLIQHFIKTNSSNSISFQLLNRFSYLNQKDGKLIDLPSSKHDLFDSNLSLINKRKLVKLFQIITNPSSTKTEPESSEFESLHSFLDSKPYEFPIDLISQLNALSISPLNPTQTNKTKSIQRLQSLLNSIGRYGTTDRSSASSFLISQYGGTGEWIESLIRSSAIQKGAVQIIGRRINSLIKFDHSWRIEVEDVERNEVLEFEAKRLIIGVDHLNLLNDFRFDRKLLYLIHRSIVLVKSNELNWEIDLLEIKHTLLIIDSETHQNPIQVLIIGSSSECCPENEVILYLSMVSNEVLKLQNPNEIFGPILDLVLKPKTEPLMKVFYTQQVFDHVNPSDIKTNHTQNQDQQDKNDRDQDTPKDMIILNDWPEEIEESGLGRLSDWVYEHVKKVMKDESLKEFEL